MKASPSRVWGALTDYKEFSGWFGVALESPFVPGQPTKGNLTIPGFEHLVMEVAVEKIEAEHLFSFHWHPFAIDPDVDYSGERPTLVEFKLQSIAVGTLLQVSECGFDALPDARRAEAFQMNSNGWAAQLCGIQQHVENGG